MLYGSKRLYHVYTVGTQHSIILAGYILTNNQNGDLIMWGLTGLPYAIC